MIIIRNTIFFSLCFFDSDDRSTVKRDCVYSNGKRPQRSDQVAIDVKIS